MSNTNNNKKLKIVTISLGVIAGLGVAGTATFGALWGISHNQTPEPEPEPTQTIVLDQYDVTVHDAPTVRTSKAMSFEANKDYTFEISLKNVQTEQNISFFYFSVSNNTTEFDVSSPLIKQSIKVKVGEDNLQEIEHDSDTKGWYYIEEEDFYQIAFKDEGASYWDVKITIDVQLSEACNDYWPLVVLDFDSLK